MCYGCFKEVGMDWIAAGRGVVLIYDFAVRGHQEEVADRRESDAGQADQSIDRRGHQSRARVSDILPAKCKTSREKSNRGPEREKYNLGRIRVPRAD